MDEAGNLWMIDQSPSTVYLIDSGVPSFTEVPWVSENPTSGTLAPGAAQEIRVTVDTTGLEPGVYNARLFINTNSGRDPTLEVPISLVVPAYYQAVDAGSTSGYTDRAGDAWSGDQAYTAGGWGYIGNSRAVTTKANISGSRTRRSTPASG
jgi:hypothetical protein